MSNTDNAKPEGFNSVTPCLTLKDCREAIAFYEKALSAKTLGVYPTPDGKHTMHAMIQIGDSVIMMGDEQPGQDCKSAESLGGSPISLYVYVPNVDEAFQQAINAGGTVTMPVADMFWGDRCGTFTDPFGYSWMLGSPNRQLTEEELMEGAKAFYENMPKG